MIRTLVLALLPALALAATDPAEMLPDPAAEARAAAIGRELRCLTCQNNSIEDSPSELARDLRRTVREQVAAGRSDAEIVAFVTDRYGDFIRLSPPVRPGTLVLWGAPVLALAIGGATLMMLRRRREAAAPAPLTPAEQARLRQLTDRPDPA
jgi:cytochrome c-type biogenesis protein CcmH